MNLLQSAALALTTLALAQEKPIYGYLYIAQKATLVEDLKGLSTDAAKRVGHQTNEILKSSGIRILQPPTSKEIQPPDYTMLWLDVSVRPFGKDNRDQRTSVVKLLGNTYRFIHSAVKGYFPKPQKAETLIIWEKSQATTKANAEHVTLDLLRQFARDCRQAHAKPGAGRA